MKLLSPKDYEDNSSNGSSQSALVDGTSQDGSTKADGFWGWLGDHGMGLVKGIGAGLIGAAVVVGVAALVIGAGAPLLIMAGAAVLGGAIYGAFTGSANFNWTEAIVGSVIGGVSAGVGSWIAGTGSSLLTRVGVAAVDVVGGGVAGVASYLIHEPHPTLGGAAMAFGVGAGTAAVFMGAGAAVSKGWKWAKGALGLGNGVGKTPPKPAMVEAVSGDASHNVLPDTGSQPRQVPTAQPTSSAESAAVTPTTRGAALREKYGHLTQSERLARIDDLAGQNYQRLLMREIGGQEYIYRYTSRATAKAYEQVGKIMDRNGGPTYMTTEASTSAREVVGRAQIMPSWTQPEVGIRVPVSALRVARVPRPKGNKLPTGWEYHTSAYPEAGPGHWMQFLGSTDTFDPAWVFDLGE